MSGLDGTTFDGCPNLQEIYIFGDSPYYCSREGLLYSKDMKTLIAVPSGKKSIVIPYCVTKIQSQAFDVCSSLIAIHLKHNNPKVISPESGAYISNLVLNQNFGNKPYFSHRIISLYVPKGTGELYRNDKNFNLCEEWIKEEEDFNSRIQNGCLKVSDDGKIVDCEMSLQGAVVIPDGVTTIYDNAFENCSGIISIEIPESVITIGKKAFAGCSGLKSIILPNNIQSIGNSAFAGCTSLSSIEIPDGVTRIGERAFSGCTSLTSISIPSSITRIEEFVFENCISLTSISIPSTVTLIKLGAFCGCTSLDSIIFNNGAFKIERIDVISYLRLAQIDTSHGTIKIVDGAFSGCTSLTSIEIPESVTKVNGDVFLCCSGLKEIHLMSKTPIVFPDALSDLDESEVTIYVPKGSGEAYLNSGFYKEFKDIIEEE